MEDNIYTKVSPPPGVLNTIVQDAMKTMYYPSHEIALACAMHCVSVFAGGLYTLGNKTLVRKRVVLADTGRGKSIVDIYFNEILRKMESGKLIADTGDWVGRHSHAINDMHDDLANHRCRSYITSEAGIAGKSERGTKQETRAYILNILASSPNSRISVNSLNRKKNTKPNPIYGAVPVFIAESVPAQYVDVLKYADAFRSGDMAREEILFIEPTKHEINFEPAISVSADVVSFLASLANKFANKIMFRGDNPDNPEVFINLDLGETKDLMRGLEKEMRLKYNRAAKHGDFVTQAMASRMIERMQVTMLILAICDASFYKFDSVRMDETPAVTKDHFDWALAYQNELTRSLIMQTKGGHLADPLTLCVEKVKARAARFGQLAVDKTRAVNLEKRIINRSWILHVLQPTKFKPFNDYIEMRQGDKKIAAKEVITALEGQHVITPTDSNDHNQPRWILS